MLRLIRRIKQYFIDRKQEKYRDKYYSLNWAQRRKFHQHLRKNGVKVIE